MKLAYKIRILNQFYSAFCKLFATFKLLGKLKYSKVTWTVSTEINIIQIYFLSKLASLSLNKNENKQTFLCYRRGLHTAPRQPVTKKAIEYFSKLNMSDGRRFIILSVPGCFWDMKMYLWPIMLKQTDVKYRIVNDCTEEKQLFK